jgi:hypothetical protein
MSDGPQNLTQHELEELAEFFMYEMSMAQRERLMAEKPVLYRKLYPDASTEAILRRVRKAITPVVSWQEMEPLADWEKELLDSGKRILPPAYRYPAVVEAMSSNQKIKAIKEYRVATGASLKDAKDAVDDVYASYAPRQDDVQF